MINNRKAFQYWNLISLAYGGDGKLYMLGGWDEDNSWIMSYDPTLGSLECLGWPEDTAQCSVICANKKAASLSQKIFAIPLCGFLIRGRWESSDKMESFM